MTDPLSPVSRPRTHIRWCVVAVATLMSSLMYLDRSCVSFCQPFIQDDLGLTASQTSWIMTFFFSAYALAQIPSGWLSDRWGGRLMLTIYILAWSLFALLIGWSTSLWMLLAMQLGHGLGQAGAYPTSAGLLSRWMPLASRGSASSIVAFGGRLGGFVAPLLTAWLIVFFVPAERSSLLTAKQLKDEKASRMCEMLAPDASPDADEKTSRLLKVMQPVLWENLSPQGRTRVRQIANSQRDLFRDQAKLKQSNPKAAAETFPLSADDKSALIVELNKLLERPWSVQKDDIINEGLAGEAKSLLKRQAAGKALSALETARLNRLILEATFPTAIGKVYVQGWRQVFTVYGLAGIAVALLFWFIVRNRPQEHPACNAEEIELIQAGRIDGPTTQASKPKLDWGKVLRSRSIWLSSISQFGTNIGWYFSAFMLPTYLYQVHHVELTRLGSLSSYPFAFGIVGMLLGGRLTDWMRMKWGVRWGRALPMGLTRFGAAAAYIGCLFTEDPKTVTILCAMVAFCTDLGVAATWAFVQDAGGRYVGVVLGFGNMWGNIGAAVAPQFYGYALKMSNNNWNVCFLICSAAMIVSGIAGLLIDASQPIVRDEPEAV